LGKAVLPVAGAILGRRRKMPGGLHRNCTQFALRLHYPFI
jgi:hypothetical protein